MFVLESPAVAKALYSRERGPGLSESPQLQELAFLYSGRPFSHNAQARRDNVDQLIAPATDYLSSLDGKIPKDSTGPAGSTAAVRGDLLPAALQDDRGTAESVSGTEPLIDLNGSEGRLTAKSSSPDEVVTLNAEMALADPTERTSASATESIPPPPSFEGMENEEVPDHRDAPVQVDDLVVMPEPQGGHTPARINERRSPSVQATAPQPEPARDIPVKQLEPSREQPEPPGEQPVPPRPEYQSAFSVQGIVSGSNGFVAVLRPRNGGPTASQTYVVSVGDVVNEEQVAEISPDSVVLQRRNAQTVLKLTWP